MKKFLLLAGILYSFTATAQQKKYFDFDKFMQERPQRKTKITGNEKLSPTFKNRHTSLFPYSNNPQLNYSLSNGDRVVTLPFDNMLCIVTDIKQFQVMPNAGRNIFAFNFNILAKKIPGSIPNAAPPFKIIIAE